VFQKVTGERAEHEGLVSLWDHADVAGAPHEPEVRRSKIVPEGVALTFCLQYPLSVEVEVGAGEEKAALRAACRSGVMGESALPDIVDSLDRVMTAILESPSEDISALLGAWASADHPEDSPPSIRAPLSECPADGESNDDWSAQEQAMRAVLSQISGVSLDKIAKRTPLYAIGLDSIAAIQVANRCRKLGMSVSVVDILTGGSIACICRGRQRTVAPAAAPRDLVSAASYEEVARTLNLGLDEVEILLPALAVSPCGAPICCLC
jgi:ferricrocin synthase